MKYKILAVDDNPINLKLLQRALINSEYEITTAGSGSEALKMVRELAPDLILLDVIMGDMDGYEVCMQLQKDQTTSHIPVIFLSAKNDIEDKKRGFAVGGVDYITKPFETEELNSRVHTHLGVRRDNIRLRRENRELHERLKVSDRQIARYLHGIRTEVHMEEAGFTCLARVKSVVPPQSIRFTPLWFSADQFVFVITCGFNKDFATLAVLLLFEQFAAGYLAANAEQNKDPEDFVDLVEKLMERFSPDIYDVDFSFGLGWLCQPRRMLSFFSIRQEPPWLLDNNGQKLRAGQRVLKTNTKYDGLLVAREMDVPEGANLCFARQGVEELTEEVFISHAQPLVKQLADQPLKTLEQCLDALPPAREDQLLAFLKID